jgi:hypothetical protein
MGTLNSTIGLRMGVTEKGCLIYCESTLLGRSIAGAYLSPITWMARRGRIGRRSCTTRVDNRAPPRHTTQSPPNTNRRAFRQAAVDSTLICVWHSYNLPQQINHAAISWGGQLQFLDGVDRQWRRGHDFQKLCRAAPARTRAPAQTQSHWNRTWRSIDVLPGNAARTTPPFGAICC